MTDLPTGPRALAARTETAPKVAASAASVPPRPAGSSPASSKSISPRPVSARPASSRSLPPARTVEGAPRRAGAADLTGCPVHDLRERLRSVGLRPTRQRVALGWLLFAKGDRHVTAEALYEEALRARVPVSLATVYNTLHQFTDSHLLREVAVDGSKTYFDTNVTEHHHFFVEGDEQLMDIPGAEIAVSDLPTAPEGMEIARVDVIVRLRRKDAAH